MHSLRKLSSLFTRRLRNNVRTLTSQPDTNVDTKVDKKEKTILVSRLDKVTMIGINRPEKRNCLDSATAQLLSETLDEFENNEETSVGVLYGVGGNFCAGYDLKEIADCNSENGDMPQFGPLAFRSELPKKPLVAALSGYAVGIGFELALMCDLRVIEDTAMVGFLNRRFGIPILCGGTVRLPALIGYSRAMDLILTGRLANAEEALNWGIAHRITSCGTALGTATTLASSLIKFPQKCLLADRTSAYFASFLAKQMEEALQFEKDNSWHLISEEGIPGAKKFVDEKIGRHGKFHNLTIKDTNIRELDESLL